MQIRDKPTSNNNIVLLSLIVLLAIILRVFQINYQDLWIDEIYSLRQADPATSLSEFFINSHNLDPNPKFYNLILRIALSAFGYSAIVARMLSMIIGVISVLAIYFLGKELKDKNLGLTAALLTAINFFNIYYSQEVRCYILCFLLSTLSFLFLIRLLKFNNIKNLIFYILATSILIYTHYYGILIFLAQIITLGIFKLNSFSEYQKSLSKSLIAVFTIGLVTLSRIPDFKFGLSTSSFWIQPVEWTFIYDYLLAYFNGNRLLLMIVFLPILISIFLFIKSYQSTNKLKLSITSVVCLTWIITVLGIALIVSWLFIPSLLPRYTIIILPALILLIAQGIQSISVNPLKHTSLLVIILFSLYDLIGKDSYYFKVTKTQFGKLTTYISQSKNHFPISNERTGWYQRFYTQSLKYEMPLVEMKHSMDSILRSDQLKNNLQGFWLVGAHVEPPLSINTLDSLSLYYTLLEQKEFYDCWAKLYISKNQHKTGIQLILPDKSNKSHYYEAPNGVRFIAIWNEDVMNWDLNLDTGTYQIVVSPYGTPLNSIYPHIELSLNSEKILEFNASKSEEEVDTTFVNMIEGPQKLKVKMTNDAINKNTNEDRNLFIKYILVRKLNMLKK